VRLLNKVKPTWVCTGRRLHIQSAFGSHPSRVYMCACARKDAMRNPVFDRSAHTHALEILLDVHPSLSLSSFARSVAFPTSIPCTRICSKLHHTLTNFNCILMHFACSISFSLLPDALPLSAAPNREHGAQKVVRQQLKPTSPNAEERHVLGKVESKCASGFGPWSCT
jgi:hypothetical protein